MKYHGFFDLSYTKDVEGGVGGKPTKWIVDSSAFFSRNQKRNIRAAKKEFLSLWAGRGFK